MRYAFNTICMALFTIAIVAFAIHIIDSIGA